MLIRSATKTSRTLVDLVLAMTIAFVLALINFSINFNDTIHRFFTSYSLFPITELIVNVLFVWLVVMLWLAFRRWKRATEQMAEYENVISSISPDTLIVVDPDRNIELINKSVKRMFGYGPEEVLFRKTDMLYFDRRTHTGRHHEIYEALERDGFHFGIAQGKRKDGSTFPMEIISGDLSGRGGAVLLLRDISERVHAEEQRYKLESRIRQRRKIESFGVLAGGIAHDFNNLLMGIMGNAELALEDLPPDSAVYPGIQEIVNISKRAGKLCKQMLAFSTDRNIELKPVNLSLLIHEMRHILVNALHNGVTVEYDLSDNLPSIDGDVSQLQQVVLNLVKNSSDAIGDKQGRVHIITGAQDFEADYLRNTVMDTDCKPGRYVYLEVSDNGCGFDDETKEKIFDPFFSTQFSGRGLGLYYVLGAVGGHNGAVTVDSQPGKGATFRILFPVGTKSEPEVENAEIAKHWQGSGTVLLVDDEETVRNVVGRILEQMGFSVICVGDGPEALEVFKEQKDEIVLVLLDMTMPVMGGAEVCREIRKIKEDALVILSSGFTEDDAVARFTGRGPTAFIHKPYEINALRKIISETLSGSAGQDE